MKKNVGFYNFNAFVKSCFLIFLLTFVLFLFSFIEDDGNKDSYFGKIFLDKNSIRYKILSSNIKSNFLLLQALLNESNYNSFFYSPLGIQILFSILLNGSCGLSFNDIQNFLNYNDFDIETINEYYKSFFESIREDKNSQLYIANSIWLNKASEIYKIANPKNQVIFSKDFVSISKNYYFTQVFEKDLSKQSEFKILEKWILNSTKSKIKNFIKKSEITPDVVLFAINAIYFKNDWQYPFDKNLTKIEDFTSLDGTKKYISFMNFEEPEKLYYYEDNNFQVVRLPYRGYSNSLLVFLPKDIAKTCAILNSFDYKLYIKIVESMTLEKGFVKFPKIKCEYEYSFNDIFKNLGFSSIFMPSKDFHPIFNKNIVELQNFLFGIGKIWQKTFLEIEEKGTTASSATGINIIMTSSAPQEKIFYFNATHPFIYFLIDDKSGNIIFSGFFNGE